MYLAMNYLRLTLAHGGLLVFAREDRALEPIRVDCRKVVSQSPMAADQNVLRVMVEGPIILKPEPTPS